MSEFSRYLNEKIFGLKTVQQRVTDMQNDNKNIIKNVENDTINIIQDFPSLETYEEKYIRRLFRHKALVYYFGRKLGKYYFLHDNDKLSSDFFHRYALTMKEHRTPSEQKLLDTATLIHITNTPHHPEAWTKTNLTGFTRSNFTPNGIIDARSMPLEFLKEMCCDWCAVSYERGNTPQEWVKQVVNIRWKFNNGQVKVINETIDMLWDNYEAENFK